MAWSTRTRVWWWIYLALACVWVTGYVVAADMLGDVGFPLDDAWIHQTYARNLASTGRWEYLPGQLSAGSTAPAWTALLAVGYWLRIPFTWWTWGLGVLSLALTGQMAHKLAAQLFPGDGIQWVPPAVGLLCVGEWHLVWAAASGMETVLYVALTLALMERAADCFPRGVGAGPGRWAGLGLVAGALVLTRPEGVLLVGLVGLVGVWLLVRRVWSLRDGVKVAAPTVLAFALLVAPYLLFNLKLSGRLWPNTLYAKQTEYAAQLAAPFLARLVRLALPPVVGFQIILIPGLILGLVQLWNGGGKSAETTLSSSPVRLVPLAYSAGHLILYALRLPVVYQHGRYLIPAIPPIILFGVWGMVRWLRPRHPHMIRRVASQSWIAAVGVLMLGFLVVGAQAFGRDVRFIQGEMVAAARWLADNSEPDEWVAAHDIGAIGFFAERPILDLAGLISPEVIPLMGDEVQLARYVLDSKARYLVTAPGWQYLQLTDRAEVTMVYSTGLRWTVQNGMNNCSIYQLPDPRAP